MNLQPSHHMVAATLLAIPTLFITSAQAIEDCGQCKRLANEWAENASPLDARALEGALQTNEAAEFLKQCGNAPVRMFDGKLFFEATEDGGFSPSRSIQSRGDMQEPLQLIVVGHEFDPRYVDISMTYGLDNQVFTGLSQYARLRSVGPKGVFQFKKGESFPVEREGISDPRMDYEVRRNEKLGDQTHDDFVSVEPKLKLWAHNEDLSLTVLARLAPPGMRLKLEGLSCPLSEIQQGDFCAKMQFPFDPSNIDEKEAIRFGNQVNPRDKDPKDIDLIEPKIFRKVTRRHDARGFAYAVQYENEKGERFPKKFKTRYSENPYFILDLLTHSPCKGWKIRKVSVNFHHKPSGGAYAYRMDRVNNELIPGKFIFGSTIELRKSEIYAAYAKDAKISFIGCNTMTGTQINKIKDPIDGHTLVDVDEGVGVGDFFSRMNDPDNPIAVVSGYDGTCYPIFPTATTPRIGKKKIWKKRKPAPWAIAPSPASD